MRAVAAVLDLCCVGLFVVIGRAGHGEAETASGLAATSWPFFAGAVAGWAVARAWRRPTALVPTGAGVWLVTVAVAMVLRAVSGQGTAITFVLVSLVFLGVTMLGWRGLAALRRTRAA